MEEKKGKRAEIFIRPADDGDLAEILDLNEALVHFLSHLTMEKLIHLFREAAVFTVAEVEGRFAGFLLAFREGADYDSINYTWFASKYPNYLYVDRIVIAPPFQGTGVGSALYQDIFRRAREDGVPFITAEYYIDPPNTVSAGFHDRFGFVQVGQQKTADGNKTVSLQAAPVTGATGTDKTFE